MTRALDGPVLQAECGDKLDVFRPCILAVGHKGSHARLNSLGHHWILWRNEAPDAYSPRPWDDDAANIDDLERCLR